MRGRSTRPSRPRPHCRFQVMSFKREIGGFAFDCPNLARFTVQIRRGQPEECMDRLSTSLASLFASLAANATDVVAQPQWQQNFDAKGVRGTFVLFEPAKDRYLLWDEAR